MLDFIERHKEGILGTIIIHLVLVTVILIMKINTIKDRESAVTLNLLNEQEVKEFLDPEENKQQTVKNKEIFTPAEKEFLGVRNIGTNEAEQKASQNIDQMVNQIKGELNIKDPAPTEMKTPPQQTPSENALPDKAAREEKVNVRSTTGIRTFYKGPTTVSYYLEGRYDVNLKIPVYKCQGNGKVAMKIEVNHEGYIEKIEIDKSQSNITDECFLEAAEKAARATRFNSINNGPPTQSGKLTYIFIGQ